MSWWQILLMLWAGGLWTVLCMFFGAAIAAGSVKQRQQPTPFEEIVENQDWKQK